MHSPHFPDDRKRPRACRIAPALAAVASLVAAAPASAANLAVDYGKGSITYVAAPGEANQFSITPLYAQYMLQDPAIPVVSLTELGTTPACTLGEPWKYRCPSSGLSAANVALGDGADSLDDSQSSLNTTVRAGTGAKSIATGAGADRIDVRGADVDTVTCGAGDDLVFAGADDHVAADCEHVNPVDVATPPLPDPTGSGDPTTGTVAGATGGDSTSSAGGDNPFGTPIGVQVPKPKVEVPNPRTAVIGLACPAAVEAGCRGDVIIEVAASAVRRSPRLRAVAARGHFVAQQRRRTRRLGKAHFAIGAGESAKVPVAIALRGHYTLATRRRRRAKGVVRIVERDTAGKVIDVQTRPVTLRLYTRKWSRKRRHR